MTDESTRRAGLVDAWRVVESCAGDDGRLRAAGASSLYPHVWTRDVGLASFGILAAKRTDADAESLLASLRLIAAHQDPLGRMPLKVDPIRGEPVLENAAGVDSGLWFALAVRGVSRTLGAGAVAGLVPAAERAVQWTMHLDANGDELLETPEAGDWADMMPHRHAVLFVNVLYAEALDAVSELLGPSGGAYESRASRVRARTLRAFSVKDCTDAQGVAQRIGELAADNPELAITGQYATRYGDLPFLLPYVAFRTVGTHCDVVGNLLAVITGVLAGVRAERFLDYLDDVGAADPAPTKTMVPPITPGHPDWRDHFLWRNLNLPNQYQNGGSWPFCGALHVAALVRAGRMERAKQLLGALDVANRPGGQSQFPEWQHGVTGRSMGEVRQLWSATGLLFASVCVETGRVPLWGPASP